MIDLIVHSARQLVTVAGPGPLRGPSQGDLAMVENGAVAVSGERIAAVGMTDEILRMREEGTQVLDARGCVVLPGLVDAHTHVVFAGDRANEFELRLRGASYLEIMQAGGGIMSTVRTTRAAPAAQIVQESGARLREMLAHGTTTAEVKTGYGLDMANEIKLLDAISQLSELQPVQLVPTFLGAHAIPQEYKGREEAYVDLVVDEMLPAARGRSVFCDVFCDEGAFTLEQSRRILARAKELGYAVKVHADEFANQGGAALAAELGATSADHLMVTTREQMRELARANVVAVLLPGTTFGLGKCDFADGRAFVEENVPVALGSDINPGTSWCGSMLMIMAIATRYEKMSPAEAIVAATLNAAYASGLGSSVGSIEAGKQADILIAEVPDYRHLAYRYGSNLIRTVLKRGRIMKGEAG